MKPQDSNAEPYELSSFSRKLESDDHLKDRLIMRHLRQRKNSFLLDFEGPNDRSIKFGASHE